MRVFLWLACWLALSLPAQAGVVFNYSTSPTTIQAGGSVSISISADFTLDGSLLSNVQAYYPSYYVDPVTVYAYDWSTFVNAGFISNGSAELDGGASYFAHSPFGSSSSSAQFTYNAPGHYVIDYSFNAITYILPIGTVWDSPEMNTVIEGPFLGGPIYRTSGEGRIDVYVGGVPEPSTWAMMLIGFAGLYFMRRRVIAAQ